MAPSRCFLAVLLLGVPAFGSAPAPREDKPPAPLVAALKKATLGEWCELGQQKSLPLEAQRWFELADGSLAVLVQVPDYLCVHSNTAIPVVVSPKGVWKWGKPLAGKLRHVSRTADGTIWAVAEWQIEDTYPTLLRTTNGLDFREVELPPARTSAGRGETVERLCVRPEDKVLEVWLEKDAAPAQVWALSAERWQLKQPGRETSCLTKRDQPEGAWGRDDSAPDRVVFRKGDKAIAIPRRLTWP